MAESSLKSRKFLFVTNPGSDSEDSNEDHIRRNRLHGFHPPRWVPAHQPTYNNYQPRAVTTDLPPVNGSALNQVQQLPPVSPESPVSPIVEDQRPVQPAVTPPALVHNIDLQPKSSKPVLPTDPPVLYDRSINEMAFQPQLTPINRKFQSPKAPFGSRPKPSGDAPRRPRASPTASMSDSVASPSFLSVSSSASVEKILMVTADSDRYAKVDISAARTAAQIRELILNKLAISDEDEVRPYSIYKTEIGAFAIGEALSDDDILTLCRDQGDSKGSLKFYVSVAPAPSREPPPPAPPVEQHTSLALPPSVSVNPLTLKRRSRSRNGSFSSQTENPQKDGYDADNENPVPRMSPQQQGAVLSPSASAAQSQQSRRRPSVVNPRPSSPLVPSEQSVPSQPPADRSWTQRKDEKYVHALPVVPTAPPLSPNRPSFSLQDEPSSVVPSGRHLHTASGSDATDRENLHQPDVNRPSRTREIPALSKLRSSSRENLSSHQSRRLNDEDEIAWESTAGRSTEESERISPSLLRGTRPQPSGSSNSRYRPTSPYNTRLPHSSRPAPPVSSLQDPRASAQQRGRQQPLPHSYLVLWKGEEAGNRKPSLASTSYSRVGKNVMKPKSMDNLKVTSPTSSSGWRNMPPPLPRNIAYSPSNLSISGTPKSYEPPRGSSFARPLPAQGSPLPTTAEFVPNSASHTSRGYSGNLTSPSYEPYQRPLSAMGDSAASPTQGYPKVTSPIYGSVLDSGESRSSPRAASPHARFPSHGVPGPRPRIANYSDPSDRSSDIQSGPETSNTTPPRTPNTPQSPRYDPSEQKGYVCEQPSSPSSWENAGTKDNGASDMTLTNEDQQRMNTIINSSNRDAAGLLRRRSQQSAATRSLTPPPSQAQGKHSYGPDDDEEESDAGGGTWIVRPGANPKSPRPALTVRVDDSSPLSRPEVPPRDSHPLRRENAILAKQMPRRPQSTFVDDDNDSWAPRPPTDYIYDDLEKFFPKHDLDRPVIDSTPGDTSPTASEAAAVPQPPAPINDEKARIRAKKSIRIVAQEHKKRIDRTSRGVADTSYSNNQLRKRNTKLWGSRLEEVTAGQMRNMTSSPDSPSGGPTTFKWVRGELIGKGTYGRVYLALNATTGEMIAVKQVELPQTASDKTDSRQHMVVQALKSESETLRDLDHPNIVQYLGFEETPTNLSIFLEYVPGGSIGRSLLKHGKFEDNVTRSFTGQILGGLEYLHSKGILHRDLKADNILVEMSGVCKISDFGISKRTEDLDGGAFTAMQGSVFWMAPEVINTQKNGYNNKIDIWSVGCVVLEMWLGMRPWNGEEMLAVMFKLYQSKQPPPVPEDLVLSEEADDFRRKCFAINPDDRPSAAELRKHRYLVLPPNWVFTGFT